MGAPWLSLDWLEGLEESQVGNQTSPINYSNTKLSAPAKLLIFTVVPALIDMECDPGEAGQEGLQIAHAAFRKT